MKKLSFVLVLAILLVGSVVVTTSAPSYAQGYAGYNYPPPPQNHYAHPWVGPNTPWVYYNGDWFLNGILYYFFGNNYGWAPYYSYGHTYIVRPNDWYAPRWNTWYQQNPHYWQNFSRQYPYWREHQHNRRYGQDFYNQHHRDQGGGWNKGFHGARPSGAKDGPGARPSGAKAGPGDHPSGAKNGPGTRAPETKDGPGARAPRAKSGSDARAPGAKNGPGAGKPGKAPHGEEKK